MTKKDFVIDEFVAPEKVNPYAEHVTALNKAGEGKSLTLTVMNDGVAKARRLFGKAANDIGKTARLRDTIVGETETALVFTLTEKQVRTPKAV